MQAFAASVEVVNVSLSTVLLGMTDREEGGQVVAIRRYGVTIHLDY